MALREIKSFVGVFDIWNKLEARFLNWDEIFLRYDFPRNSDTWVPVLYVGPYNEHIIVPLANGKSTIRGADNVREGIVIGTILEQYNNEVGRKKLKIVSNEYLERSK